MFCECTLESIYVGDFPSYIKVVTLKFLASLENDRGRHFQVLDVFH